MVFLTDFSGSYAIQYNRAANFTARTTKKICQLQKKFSEVPAKISRCSMKSFGLCHLKSFGLSQDLPLSQNGQNFRREKLGNRGKGLMSPMEPLGPLGLIGNGPGLEGLFGSLGPVGSFGLFGPVAPTGRIFISLPSCRDGCIFCLY